MAGDGLGADSSSILIGNSDGTVGTSSWMMFGDPLPQNVYLTSRLMRKGEAGTEKSAISAVAKPIALAVTAYLPGCRFTFTDPTMSVRAAILFEVLANYRKLALE